MSELQVFRAAYCDLIALLVVTQMGRHRVFLSTRGTLDHGAARVLDVLPLPRLRGPAFLVAGVVLVLSLICVGLQFAPRVAAGVSLAAYFLYFGQITDLEDVRRKTNAIPLVLVVLGSSQPARESLSLLLIKVIAVQPYLSAGIEKLRKSGLQWADGIGLRTDLVEHHLWSDSPLALWLAHRLTLSRWFAGATLFIELTIWIVLLVPALGPVYAIAVLALHAGIWRALRINYLRYFAPIHLQPFYREQFGFHPGMFPIAESVSQRTIALPFYNDLPTEDIDLVCQTLEVMIGRENLVRT